ncbi:hypothetical protein [Hoylesella shahii]|uniref:hypothetical protein n=1 Tax=Hoylesella shahii TaxID=228603 RepID=UPI00248EE4F9|nr:hypothetical protein [Hoylesella shahii]
MYIYNDKFRKARRDYSPYLFHIIKGETPDFLETMTNILNEMKLKSERGYICISASPLTSIVRFFETNVNRTEKTMFLSFGIGFSRDILVRDFGARNVIYYYDDEKELIPEELEWRALRLNGDTSDFEYLREWRINGKEFDFKDFPTEDIIVVAPDRKDLNDLVVSHDVGINLSSYDMEPFLVEEFKREWKGVAVNEVKDFMDDFDMSGSTATQKIG